jgi:hypothetical protein
LAGSLCATVVCSSAVVAQDLGGRGRRPIERGPVDVALLTQRADLIVRGAVTNKQARWLGRVIYTHYDASVLETLKGAPRTSVVLAVIGEAIGNVALSVPGAAPTRTTSASRAPRPTPTESAKRSLAARVRMW